MKNVERRKYSKKGFKYFDFTKISSNMTEMIHIFIYYTYCYQLSSIGIFNGK